MCVAVAGETIAYAGARSGLPARYAELPQHEFGDATIMPGLIDCHVHIEFDPGHALHSQPTLSQAEHTRQMQARARSMVLHGITTARDLGGKGGAFALRELIEKGHCLGPRLLCAGQPLTKASCLCDHPLGTPLSAHAPPTRPSAVCHSPPRPPRPGSPQVRGHCHQWGGEVGSVADIEQVAARQHERGADLIKVMATGGVRTAGTNPAEAVFTQARLPRARPSSPDLARAPPCVRSARLAMPARRPSCKRSWRRRAASPSPHVCPAKSSNRGVAGSHLVCLLTYCTRAGRMSAQTRTACKASRRQSARGCTR